MRNIVTSTRHFLTSNKELAWGIGIGTALAFPVVWFLVAWAAAYKAGCYLELRYTLWRQSKRGPCVLEINGRSFACFTHPDGTISVSELGALRGN